MSPLNPVTYEILDVRLPTWAVAGSRIHIERSWDRLSATASGAVALYPKIPVSWSEMWCIRLSGNVFTRGGSWEYEPQPSSRTWAFIKRTRFPSAQAAHEFLLKSL